MSHDGKLAISAQRIDLNSKIVEQLEAEDVPSFDRLYEENSSYIYNACLGILGDREDAKDAAQETFIQLYRSLPRIRSGHRTWLYRVAVNRCMKALRRRRKCKPVESLEWFPEESGDDSLIEERVRQAVLRLKPDYRAVIVLFYFQQLSYAEIAESLRCSDGQVRNRLHRARKAFRVAFNDGGGDDEV